MFKKRMYFQHIIRRHIFGLQVACSFLRSAISWQPSSYQTKRHSGNEDEY